MVHGTPDAPRHLHPLQETVMQWTTPTAQDIRFGFEITAYSAAR